MKSRNSAGIFVLIFSLAVSALAQSAKVERTGAAPRSTPPDVRTALDDRGYRVTLDDGWTAELWTARDLKLTPKDAPGALYPQLSNSEFIAVVNLPKGMTDFRGQAIPAGAYTLRYQLLPQDGNHLGVAPNPDFLLAIPVANDANPNGDLPFEKLVKLSSKSTGAHPAVIAMEKAGEPGSAVFDEQKMLVLTVGTGKAEKLGIVLKGQAAQ